MKKFTFLLFALLSFSVSAQQIAINEIVTSNTTINTDEDGTYQDWVELYNNGPAAVNLNGYGLTDDPALPFKWTFPAVTVDPGQFLLVFCSDKNRTVVGQPLHTNWKISSSGETITLTQPGGAIADQVPATAIAQNASFGRFPDGTGAFEQMTVPTPNAANQSTTANPVLAVPVFSQPSGFYTSSFNLSLSAAPGTTILYTLDGSEPDESNLAGTTYSYKVSYPEMPGQPFGAFENNTFQTLQYAAPIIIADRTSQANKLAKISSTYEFDPTYIPDYNVYKGTVVRAKAIKPGADPSPVVTHSYFIAPQGNSRFTLPVISLSIDEDQLFDYEDGIYVAGKLFDDYRTDNPTEILDYPIGNYTQKGSAFERRANFNYFVGGQEVINQDIGIRVQGNYSRIYPNKSLNFYSRAEFGDDNMSYNFFNDRPFGNFSRLCVKNSGSDYFNSFIKDALCAELLENLHTVTEASQPAVTFLNGEYWGLMTIREKYDDKFFKRAFGVPENEIELLENDGLQIEEGDNPHYLAMVDYFENNSLVPEANFNYIKTQMDTESFTDYFISNIYLNNTDWPGNNIVYWRRNTAYNPSAPYGNDGRWRWAAHDMTSTFRNAGHDNLAVATSATGSDWPNPQWSTLQLRKLLENETFKNDFISRFADLMNTTFLPSRVVAMVDEMKAEIAAEMPEQMPRWGGPVDLGDWNYFLNLEKTFANNRPAPQRDQIRSKFAIANNLNATIGVSNFAHGFVKINTIEIKDGTDGIAANPYPWTGVYFSNIPIKLKAIAKPGYVFSHWTGASTATDAEITITTAADFSVTAVFIPEGFAIETPEPIYFWWMSGAIPNDTPLLALNSSYEITADASIQFQSAFAGYPFNAAHPNWRKASMERRNKPTPINYRPEANGGLPYVAGDMKALQVTQPFQDNGLENTMVFNLSTTDYKNIKFSFAAMDEGAATGIAIDYAVNTGAPVWVTTGLPATTLPLTTNTFQLYETDFTSIATANNNPDFKVRLRFTGPNMTASAGNRVTFNNIAVDGVRLPLIYPSPNVFTVGTPIANLVPEVAASASSYSIAPALPAGLVFDTTTGIISGTPTAVAATATYTVTATNAGGSASFGIVITVNDIAPPALSYATPNVFTIGNAIADLTPTVSGNVISYSIAPTLPDGLGFDTATGIISGTPTTVTATSTYTVTASNSGGNVSFDISITVNDVAPSALSYATPNVFTVGTAIADLTPTVSGNVISYSIAPTLPDGLGFDTATGIISGTPTAVTATSTYTVTASNSGGSITFDIAITVNDVAPSALSYATPNVFTVGTTISDLTPTVSGNVISYAITPTLPDGLGFDTTTGIISGTPTIVTATTTYTVTASNSGGSITFDIAITMNDVAPSALSYTTPNVFTIGNAIADLTPTVSGNVISYAITPTLPDGLVFDTTTGIISGTPTTVMATSTYTVTASNSGGNVSFDVSITVNDVAPPALSYATPNVFTIGNAIADLTPTVSGNVISYAITPTLPDGLVFDTTTGIISGTPTTVMATSTYTVTASNSGGNVSFDVSITVNDVAPSALSYATPNVFTVGTAIADLTPTVSGNVISYSIAPTLPDGLVFDTATGIISGTPTTVTATATYTVTASNSGGSITFDVVISVETPLLVGTHTVAALVVYPNPFTDYIYVKGLDEVSYALFSVEGKLIEKGKVPASGIELRSLPNGLYLLQLTANGASETKKIIKK